MARPSKLTDKQWAEIEDVASQLNTMSDNEQSAILQLRIAILAGDLERWLGVNKIERHRFEFNVSAGRIDFENRQIKAIDHGKKISPYARPMDRG